MKRLILTALTATILSSGAVFAQTSQTPAVAPKTTNPSAPVPGANSFTEAQAKERIEKAGYTGVTGLAKDANGVWMGKASKGGTMASVMLDYQGNVTSK